MKKILCSLLLLFSFVFPTYAESSEPITQEQAIEIAKQYAINKIKPESWFGGRVTATFENDQWIILFDSKPNEFGMVIVGDHFGIVVSAEGKVLWEHRGR